MTPPNDNGGVSMCHGAFVEAVQETADDPTATANERWLAKTLLAVYRATDTNPDVIDVINETALRAIEKAEQHGTR